jgi:hypothetical protein
VPAAAVLPAVAVPAAAVPAAAVLPAVAVPAAVLPAAVSPAAPPSVAFGDQTSDQPNLESSPDLYDGGEMDDLINSLTNN